MSSQTPDLEAEEIAHYRDVLRKLVDMGFEIAADLHRQATAPAEPGQSKLDQSKPDLTIPFDRISRAVRRTILLARKLAEPIRPQLDRVAARKRIIREVEDQIERHAYRDSVNPDALRVELGDRLDSPDLEDDLQNLPLEEIIKDLCSDLGVGQMPAARIIQWRRRTPEDIETLKHRAARPPTIPLTCPGLGPVGPVTRKRATHDG